MKKKILIPTLSVICVLLLAAVIYFASASDKRTQTDVVPSANTAATDSSALSSAQEAEPSTTIPHNESTQAAETADKSDRLSVEKAMKIAIENAGFAENEVWDKDIDLDYEKGALVYEVSFEKDYVEYNYVIDPFSGEILHSKNDAVPSTVAPSQAPEKSETTAPSAASSESRITAKQARSIALKNAGFDESEVWDKEAELDYENGVLVYEVSFEKNNTDYEYIINAFSGEIIRSEVDPY